ncbi:translesion error-prone DNA polymerase V autoproteolytic subunit [Flavisolibacter sp. BT320]|nr:translesion error-prone DNA polymerase V autoproteolytic subunit [Flavisolibacter longurius]
MEGENFFYSSYKGTKEFTQNSVRTANATGFGAAADDYAERGIDLNEHLVKNKPATFFLRVNSDAMTGAGVQVGDVVIVDRSLTPQNGSLVIAVVDGELLIRKLEISNNRTRLATANKKLSSLDVTGSTLHVWGVVTYVIHKA